MNLDYMNQFVINNIFYGIANIVMSNFLFTQLSIIQLSKKKQLFAVLTTGGIYGITGTIVISFFIGKIIAPFSHLLLNVLLKLIFCSTVIWFKKIRLLDWFYTMIQKKGIAIFSVFTLEILLNLFYYYLNTNRNFTDYFLVEGFAIFMMGLSFASLIANNFYTKDKLIEKDAMLLEQQNYVQNLENIQRELRSFQHDYKNIIAGLYLI